MAARVEITMNGGMLFVVAPEVSSKPRAHFTPQDLADDLSSARPENFAELKQQVNDLSEALNRL